MHRGYIKLWRKALDTGWLKNHKLWAFWSYCLLKATHKDHEVIVGFQRVHLRAGQFVFGRKVASIETGLSEQEIRTILKHLEKLGNLTIYPTNKYSILTIENWADYQCDAEISTSNPTCIQPASNQQVTTYKNVKNIRTKEEKILHLEKVLLTDDEHIKLVEQFGETKAQEFIQRLNDYIQSVGKKYKSHYHTILNWSRRDGAMISAPTNQAADAYDVFLRALLRSKRGELWTTCTCPQTRKAVEAMGGPERIRTARDNEQPFLKKQFIAEYGRQV